MTLIMLKLFKFVNDLFVALETKLDKVVFSFQIAFITTIYMFSSIDNIDIIKLKDF